MFLRSRLSQGITCDNISRLLYCLIAKGRKEFRMNGAKKQDWVRKIVFFCTALLFIAFFIGETDLRRREIPMDQLLKNAAVFVLLILLIPFAARHIAGRERICALLSRSEIRNLLILLVLAVVPRIIWGLAAPPRIDSDYGLYVRMGQYYAGNGRPEMDNYLLTVAPNAVTYSVLTGLVMRLFGTTAMTLVVFAEILNISNVLLVYGVGRQLTSGPRAFTAAAVFALLPENVFYSNIPGIEAAAMFTALAGLLLILAGRHRKPAACALCCGAGGMVLAFSACIRPNAYVILAAALIYLLREKEPGQPVRRKGLRLLALLAGAALVLCGHQVLKADLFAEERPVSGLGWSLYEGLDLESGGKWTEEKSKRCIEVIDAYSPEEADAVFRKEALERFGGYTFTEKLLMFLRKGGSLWYESRYSIFSLEGTGAWDGWRRMADFSWTACLAVLIAVLLYSWRKPGGGAAGLMLTIILVTTAWHMAGTSIGRYHYMLIPFVLLLAAMLLPGKEKKPVPERSTDK